MRNLPFDLKEKHLTSTFAKFGTLSSISVPLNLTNNLNRGFAFVEFEKKADALKAVESLHGSKFKGRTLAVEFSLPKGRYETKVKNIVEHSKMERADVIVPKVIKEEREGKKKEQEEEKKKRE